MTLAPGSGFGAAGSPSPHVHADTGVPRAIGSLADSAQARLDQRLRERRHGTMNAVPSREPDARRIGPSH
ncbi:exported protein of unknown function (plasmid) [Ralstonia solanacearum CMR15]|nr:exported protein of unknown function [Ralstonia solanacearum CMR15]